MRISDWSSDVCSSDLSRVVVAQPPKSAGSSASEAGARKARRARADPFDSIAYSPARKRPADRVRASGSPSHDYGTDADRSPDAGPRRGRSRTMRVSPPMCLMVRSEEHTSELKSLILISYAGFSLK